MLVRVKGKTFASRSGRPMHGSFPRSVTQLHVQKWRRWKKRSAEQNNLIPLQQRRKLMRHRGQKRLKACGSNEKPATWQLPGRARDSWDNRSAKGGLSSGSNVEDMRNRLRVHRCGARRLRCGLDSSTQRQDESSRNATRHGLKIVPESSQKQEDMVNSVCHELQTNPQLRTEHAMKSHTCRINRGVRGA